MALLDPDSGSVVVRVIYDGALGSGKTTSLTALASQLPRHRRGELCSFCSETGQTLYFDLLEFEGGVIDGYQIRCQIATVPGALPLEKRRFVLLSLADVVIFVTGMNRPRLKAGSRDFAMLHQFLQPPREPPVGVVLQANRRDDEIGLPLNEIEGRFGTEFPIVETNASKGEGIRKAFIVAVRQGVTRTRRLISTNSIAIGQSEGDGGKGLRNLMDELAPIPGILSEGEEALATTTDLSEPPRSNRYSLFNQPSEYETQKISADRVRAIRAVPT